MKRKQIKALVAELDKIEKRTNLARSSIRIRTNYMEVVNELIGEYLTSITTEDNAKEMAKIKKFIYRFVTLGHKWISKKSHEPFMWGFANLETIYKNNSMGSSDRITKLLCCELEAMLDYIRNDHSRPPKTPSLDYLPPHDRNLFYSLLRRFE